MNFTQNLSLGLSFDGFSDKLNSENLKESIFGDYGILSSKTSIIAVVAVLALVVLLSRMKKIKISSKEITAIGVAAALSTILSMIKFFEMPQGGSVTLASIVPILFVAYVYGAEVGFFTGFIAGILSLLLGAYIIHPVQMLLDYILPMTILGMAGYFRVKSENKTKEKSLLVVGVVVAVLLKYVCHVLSGVVFFSEYAGDQNVWAYSLGYNSFVFVDMLIAIVVLSILPIERLEKTLKITGQRVSKIEENA